MTTVIENSTSTTISNSTEAEEEITSIGTVNLVADNILLFAACVLYLEASLLRRQKNSN